MMAIRVVKMPDIGEGIAEVELVAWHVAVGERVAEDQTLADVMTDKASVEIPSPVAGTVLALGGEVGESLAVGAELVRIEAEGEAPVAVRAEPVRAEPRAVRAEPEPVRVEPQPVRAEPVEAPASVRAEPVGARARSPEPAERPIASPSVRRRAWELGIELKEVEPSGPGGRILHADLDAHAARRPGAAPAAAPRPATDEVQSIRVIGLRRKIAQRMQDAKRRIPHFTYVEEVDATEIEALRARLNERFEAARGRLTLLPLLLRALVRAVREFPQVNATFDDEAGVVHRHSALHAGIATQTPHGLLVPVLRHAESRDPWDAAREIARLADVARAGHATRDELGGSTLTVTSLGALGGIVSTPVINAPEVAIVGVNRIVERPVMRAGMVASRRMMNLSSSFDHRVVDGADAAAFIQAVRAYLEAPGLLFVE
jgi:2-oxoisovalerate dehydrogenase E2 component (dihydrolipoyl transacylase)